MDENTENLADIGQALLAAVAEHADEGWHPANCPSEIVGDLRSQRDEAFIAVENLEAENARLLARAEKAEAELARERGRLDYVIEQYLSKHVIAVMMAADKRVAIDELMREQVR